MSATSQVPVGLKVGEYEITGFLGEGGMGTVYAGVHPVIGKKVAIKVLSPQLGRSSDLIARFIQEARAVNHIGHPNIIDVFAFGESPELGHYFVMPLLAGESLAERLARGPLPLEEAVSILEKVIEALAAAHRVGICHRDLKPDNIFLAAKPTGGYVVKVLDFGIAKLSDGNAMTVTKTGVPMGTPLFMSPEQWEGIDVDHRTDIYALGVLLHHMVTGTYPFTASNQVALMKAHCEAAPVLPSHAGGPALLDPIVARALAKDRERRFQSTAELLAGVKSVIAGGPIQAPVEVARPQTRWIVALGAVAVLGTGGVVLAVTAADREPPASPAEAAPAAVIDAAPPPAIDAALALADAAVVETVEIRLDSRPRGASVISEDGEILGTTPVTVTLRKDPDVIVRLTLRRRGRLDRVIEVRPSKDRRYAAFALRRGRAGTGTGTGAGTGAKKNTWGKTGNPFDD